MFFQVIAYVLVPLISVFFFWAKRRLNSLGNLHGVGKTVHFVERHQEVYEAFKASDKIAGFYSMLKPTVMLLDLDLIKNVLIKDFNIFTDRGVYYNENADPVSAHM